MGPSILSNIDYFYVSKALLNYGLNINDLGYKKDVSVETNLKPKGFIEILKRPFKIDTIAFKLLQKNIFLQIETILNDYYNLNITGPYSIVFNPDTLFSSFDIKIQNALIKFIQTSKIYSFYLEHSNVSLDEIESLIKFAKEQVLNDSSNISKDSIISYLSKFNFKNFFFMLIWFY